MEIVLNVTTQVFEYKYVVYFTCCLVFYNSDYHGGLRCTYGNVVVTL